MYPGENDLNDVYNRDLYRQQQAQSPRTDINSATRTAEVKNEFVLTPQAISSIRDVLHIDGVLQDNARNFPNRLDFDDDTYIVKTTATGTDRTSFETARIGQYRSGAEAVAGLYVQKDDPPTGTAEWGYMREPRTVEGVNLGLNGLYYRYEPDGSLSFVIEREGIETVIPQSEWGNREDDPREITDENGDVSGKLYGLEEFDGTNHTEHDLDPAEGYIYRIDFTWYGGGVIAPKVVIMDAHGRQNSIDLFAFKPTGQTSISQPNQPLAVRLDNEGTASADSIKVAGRQFSVIGNFDDAFRETSTLEETLALQDTNLLVKAFRRKPEYSGVELGVRDILNITNGRAYLSIKIDADFGAQTPDWGPPEGLESSPDETAIQVATQDTGGTRLSINDFVRTYNGTPITGGQNQQTTASQRGEVDFPVIREQPVAIVCRKLVGSSVTLNASTARITEAW